MRFRINLRQAIYSLSTALDMVGVDDEFHGKRVAYMATECAKALRPGAAQFDDLVFAALLHDCGVSSTRTHKKLIAELDWEGAQAHCELGSRLLQSCKPLAHLAPVILHHHTHISDFDDTVMPEVVLHANLIYLVDRVDALAAQHDGGQVLAARHDIRRTIAGLRGRSFRSDLVDAFLAASDNEKFWLEREPDCVDRYLGAWLDKGEVAALTFATLRDIASLFSHVVDAKSAFTAEHSHGVAGLARRLGEWFALPETNVDKLEIAGLLHDLGKLRVPDEILDKPGRLDKAEFAVIERHSIDSYQVLGGIEGLEDIAEWAGQHHECINGQGYPAHRTGAQLSLEARILAAADVFQALAQSRPYRASLPLDRILAIMNDMAAAGRLDVSVVARIAADPRAALDAACARRPSLVNPAERRAASTKTRAPAHTAVH